MKNKSAHLHIRCTSEFKEAVRAMAVKHHRTMSSQVISIIVEEMAREERAANSWIQTGVTTEATTGEKNADNG